MPPTMPKAKALLPFRYGTRRRTQFIQSVTYTGTNATSRPPLIEIPKVGYLSSIWLEIIGNMDFTVAAAAMGKDGLAGLFENVQVVANLGSAQIVDVSGAGLAVAHRTLQPMGPRATLVALGASPARFAMNLRVPIAANFGRNFELGLINLQDPAIQVGLKLTFAPLTAIITTALGVATTITVNVHYSYFEVPDPRRFMQPPRAIVRTLEEPLQNLNVAPGFNSYQIPRMGTMLNIAGISYVNGARAVLSPTVADIQETRLRFNKTDVVEDRTAMLHALLDADAYGMLEGNVLGVSGPVAGIIKGAAVPPNVLEDGVYLYDFWNAEGQPSSGDLRDAIDTEALTTTELLWTFASTANIQPTDTVRFVRRIFQVLQ